MILSSTTTSAESASSSSSAIDSSASDQIAGRHADQNHAVAVCLAAARRLAITRHFFFERIDQRDKIRIELRRNLRLVKIRTAACALRRRSFRRSSGRRCAEWTRFGQTGLFVNLDRSTSNRDEEAQGRLNRPASIFRPADACERTASPRKRSAETRARPKSGISMCLAVPTMTYSTCPLRLSRTPICRAGFMRNLGHLTRQLGRDDLFGSDAAGERRSMRRS